MTTLPQPDTFRIPGQFAERFAPSGTVEFGDNEQVDLHASRLMSVAELSRTATELAAPTHEVTPNEVIDRGRVEFGRDVIAVEQYVSQRESPEHIDTMALVQIGRVLFALRMEQAQRADQSRER